MNTIFIHWKYGVNKLMYCMVLLGGSQVNDMTQWNNRNIFGKSFSSLFSCLLNRILPMTQPCVYACFTDQPHHSWWWWSDDDRRSKVPRTIYAMRNSFSAHATATRIRDGRGFITIPWHVEGCWCEPNRLYNLHSPFELKIEFVLSSLHIAHIDIYIRS